MFIFTQCRKNQRFCTREGETNQHWRIEGDREMREEGKERQVKEKRNRRLERARWCRSADRRRLWWGVNNLSVQGKGAERKWWTGLNVGLRRCTAHTRKEKKWGTSKTTHNAYHRDIAQRAHWCASLSHSLTLQKYNRQLITRAQREFPNTILIYTTFSTCILVLRVYKITHTWSVKRCIRNRSLSVYPVLISFGFYINVLLLITHHFYTNNLFTGTSIMDAPHDEMCYYLTKTWWFGDVFCY